jgi:hypothetical protein
VASGKGPDVRDACGPEQNAPEDDDRPDAQAGFLFSPWCANLHRRLRIMPTETPSALRVRVRAENPNHHLWNNHGTWFIHYTVHPTPFTKERVRRSLGTPALAVARERRDAFFAHRQAQTCVGPVRSAAAA